MTSNDIKQPFDECNKVLSSLSNPKISKMIMTSNRGILSMHNNVPGGHFLIIICYIYADKKR